MKIKKSICKIVRANGEGDFFFRSTARQCVQRKSAPDRKIGEPILPRLDFANSRAFTLVETLVGIAVFLIISTAAYQAYISLFSLINLNQYKIIALNLANEQFEIVRNLSYSDVGVTGSIPNGKIPHIQNLIRSNVSFTVTTTIRNIDLPFDGTIGGSPNDLSPADNKVVEVQVDCATCKNFTPVNLTTNVAPKSLETSSTNGALFIKVFDANGVPVSGASVHIENTKISPNIIIDDVTNNEGILQIIDAPPGVQAYKIVVSKNGYSTDRTYTTGSGNTKPTKPDATVIIQQVTQISFSIDKLSSLTFSSLNQNCSELGNIDFNLKGEKEIGEDILKYSQNIITNSSGAYSNTSMEWDSYTVTGIDDTYDIVGINPLNPIGLNPNSSQNISLIMETKNPRSLLITIKDSSTKLPITNAMVRITNGISFSQTRITGRGFINQTLWSDGSYFLDDGNITVSNPDGEIKLKKVFGSYNPSGWLESNTIDTGSLSNFYNISWSPVDQPIQTGLNSVRLQFASSTTPPTVWEYKGPDGTANSYYTSPDSIISQVHNGDRFVRYKVYLRTENDKYTPNVSDISFTLTTSCTPPGQVIFSGLSSDTYGIEVNATGYPVFTDEINVNSPWQEKEIILSQ